jgi:hypothetical protein
LLGKTPLSAKRWEDNLTSPALEDVGSIEFTSAAAATASDMTKLKMRALIGNIERAVYTIVRAYFKLRENTVIGPQAGC